MNRIILIALGLVALLAADASACNRCGLFGNRCRFVHHAPVVQQVVAPVVQQPDVFVVQNNYPAPLVGQGSVQYLSTGYQAAVLPLFDPNRYASQALELQKAVNGTQSLMASSATALLSRVAELQAPAVERLATGQAAQMVLQAAGLDPAHNAGSPASQAVVISRDAQGRLQVLPLTAEQSLSIQAKTTITTDAPPERAVAGGSLLNQFCAKCHGLDLTAPKGSLYLGDEPNVAKGMKDKFFDIQRRLRAQGEGQMPPAGSPQPTAEEKGGILDEIETIITK